MFSKLVFFKEQSLLSALPVMCSHKANVSDIG